MNLSVEVILKTSERQLKVIDKMTIFLKYGPKYLIDYLIYLEEKIPALLWFFVCFVSCFFCFFFHKHLPCQI